MALNDKAFEDDLFSIFEEMWNSAENNPRNNRWYAQKLSKRINDEIRKGDVQPGIPVSTTQTTGIGKIL
jgi:hypothetical protein